MADDRHDPRTVRHSLAMTGGVGVGDADSVAGGTTLAPGVIVAGRYRLVTLLGRGGMGEVYRADDLTLDQPVALKFLPENVAVDASRLGQFHNELRIARQVSHRNVCRLYDLGEANGRRFLTMEYVDGEDLASLLRRIGRLPHDKAVEIARQLCAGLAAAHERGVLHRDLKPANVMLDGDGHVRITDFGLAASVQEVGPSRAGTPQYMAPEQFTGQPASVRSDVYALGLILFEVFTGRRVHEAKTLEELQKLHQSGSVPSPSSVVHDLDPVVERVILRCLDASPEKRPASALAVAAALPGANPLAEALAAGETPSPELVAAAGQADALRPVIGLSILAVVVLGVLGFAAASQRTTVPGNIPLDRPLDALEDRAREMVERLGYTDPPADTARGLLNNNEYLQYVSRTDRSPDRWTDLRSGDFPSIRFWYRTGPRSLVPTPGNWTPTFDDPQMSVAGMTSIVLDTKGRLVQFLAVPPQTDNAAGSTSPTDWNRLFEAAQLPMGEFRQSEPQWTPYSYADEREAWEGPMPGHPDITLRVEVAAYAGRPVFFRVIGPWTVPSRQVQSARSLRMRVVGSLGTAALLGFIVVAALLARRHYAAGRGDLRSAARLSGFVALIVALAWIVGARHSADLAREQGLLFNGFLQVALVNAGLMWVMYLALEPFVRRYCPETLFSWTRLLAGNFRDPLVGRDILIGVAVGVVFALSGVVFYWLPTLLGNPPPIPWAVRLQFLSGGGDAVRALLMLVPDSLLNGTLAVLMYVALRAAVGRVWMAAVLTVVVSILLSGRQGDVLIGLNLVRAVLSGTLIVFTLVRFGLLPVAISFFITDLLQSAPLTLDMSTIYSSTSTWLMLAILVLAGYGYYASRGGQPLFVRQT